MLRNANSNRHRKTLPVKLGGTDRKYMFLLGEILSARAGKKSADAIVAMTPAEGQEQRRAKESRKNHSPISFYEAYRSLKRSGVIIALTTATARQAGQVYPEERAAQQSSQ